MKKGTLRRTVSLLLAVTFVVTSAVVVKQTLDKAKARAIYQQAMAAAMTQGDAVPAASQPQAPSLPDLPSFELPEDGAFLQTVDLQTLRQTNEDVLGWLHIPGSPISYPLMRSHDNDEYLHQAWDGSPNVAGSIFLEQYSRPDFTDFNTIIYGHAMADGSMFAYLHTYQWQDIAEKYPHVYVAIDGAVLRYTVFASYEADVSSDTYRLSFTDEAHREQAIGQYRARSTVTSSVEVTADDHILTLSTCTGNRRDVRFVVQAVLDGMVPR